MLKSALALGFLVAAIAFVPAQAAEEMTCNEAAMMKMQTNIDKMTDSTKHDLAANEMSMAKAAMAKKDDKECMMHMEKIHGMM